MCSSSLHGEKDCKVLSYGDIVLYQSDVNTLLPGVWLNDNIISFACEFLMDNASEEVKRQVSSLLVVFRGYNCEKKCSHIQVAVVGAASCELIRYAGDETIIREIFASLNFFNKEKVRLHSSLF